MAYANVKGEQANHMMRKIPYTIIPGEEGTFRKDIFLERAIVEERVRLAIGLPTAVWTSTTALFPAWKMRPLRISTMILRWST